MKLFFQNSQGISRQLAICTNQEEVFAEINNFINICNKNKPIDRQFKSYYTRIWTDNEKTWYDVGSHSEFFYTEYN